MTKRDELIEHYWKLTLKHKISEVVAMLVDVIEDERRKNDKKGGEADEDS